MSKLIKIAFILLTFTAQSVMAVSVHCSMDMSSMDMGSMEISSDMHSGMGNQADMHAAMGHHDMDGTTSDSKQSMDCCDSINECPTGTCSAPALSGAFADVLSIASKSSISREYNHQVQ